MPEEKKSIGVGWIILVVVVLVVLVGVFLLVGWTNIGKIISAVFWAVIVGTILLLIGFIIYNVFFKKRKVDIVAVCAKKLIVSAHICKPNSLRDLYLSGDRMHERVKIGRITGYCKVLNYDNIEENVITYKKLPFPFNLFEEEKIVRVADEDMTAAVGDMALFGLSLIKLSEYYYLHKDMMNVKRIDYTILQEAKRGVLFLALSEMKEIVDKAIDLDSTHRKDLETNRLIKPPDIEPPAQ